ncbi:hypothetical protein RSAG8_07167, partial [Rhizoctonia solani AG-8 WAC10335]
MIYGAVIDSQYLKDHIAKYKNVPVSNITAKDRSDVAFQLMAQHKQAAVDHVDKEKRDYGNGMIYGTVIDSQYLKDHIAKYKDVPVSNITAKDRSDVAFQLMSTHKQAAVDHVDKEKRDYGNGVSTLVLVYNATGDRISVHDNYSWHGHFYSEALSSWSTMPPGIVFLSMTTIRGMVISIPKHRTQRSRMASGLHSSTSIPLVRQWGRNVR